MHKVMVLGTEQLRQINDDAIAAGLNRSAKREIIDRMAPDGIHIVGFSMIHNDTEIRAEILCKEKGKEAPTHLWLDMSFENWGQIVALEVKDGEKQSI